MNSLIAKVAPATVLAVLVSGCGLADVSTTAPRAEMSASEPAAWESVVPKALCGPNDQPETGLQGQVPQQDRANGRATLGYWCGMKLVSSQARPITVDSSNVHANTAAWATLDIYKDCAYYGDSSTADSNGGAGVVVVDVTDPFNPIQTDYLTTEAMKSPWEALRVHAGRGLLVTDRNANSFLDIYSIKEDCRHPKLLFSEAMPSAIGHEGWFSTDGTIYWMSDLGKGVWPIDLTDPAHPKELGFMDNLGSVHGGSTNDDGTRTYMCGTSPNRLVIVDSSDVQAHKTDLSEAKVVSEFPIPEGSACQATYWVTYGGKPYVIQYGEASSIAQRECGTEGRISTWDHARIIDISDEKNPKLVARLMLEIHDPANCELTAADFSARGVSFFGANGYTAAGGSALFGYSVHHCTPDRIHDPTVLACGHFDAGLRVFDIRNPYQPKELAYYNAGTYSLEDTTVDGAVSRPIVRPERGEIWWTTEFRGFHVGKFYESIYPFEEKVQCPAQRDWLFSQSNPGLNCQ